MLFNAAADRPHRMEIDSGGRTRTERQDMGIDRLTHSLALDNFLNEGDAPAQNMPLEAREDDL